MRINPIKTLPITSSSISIEGLLGRYVKSFPERAILVVTSKVIALCEGRTVAVESIKKEQLIRSEAEYWLPPGGHYGIALSVKGGRLIPTAGIDESNGDSRYVLWPADPYASAQKILLYLRRRFKVRSAGVIITDSTTAPLRLGTVGICIGHAGFNALNDYIGTKDIFGRGLKVTQANIADGLAAAAVVVMGEGGERQPLATIKNVPFVQFNRQKIKPRALRIKLSEDLYAPLLKKVKWRKGGQFGKVI